MKTKLFILAGVANILGAGGALLLNNDVIDIYPAVFSKFGLVAIILWGLAYIAVSKNYDQVRWLVLVFFVEKAAYVVSWIYWWYAFGDISNASFQARFFLVTYGLIDAAFGGFFGWVFFSKDKGTGKNDKAGP